MNRMRATTCVQEQVRNPGPEDLALICPRKGLLVVSENPGVRSQESEEKDIIAPPHLKFLG